VAGVELGIWDGEGVGQPRQVGMTGVELLSIAAPGQPVLPGR